MVTLLNYLTSNMITCTNNQIENRTCNMDLQQQIQEFKCS